MDSATIEIVGIGVTVGLAGAGGIGTLLKWSLDRNIMAMDKKIEENGQQKLLHDIELPLAHVLSSMEQTGFAVDRDGIAEFGKQLGERIAKIEQEIYALVGYEFNLNSPKQLGEALFEKLKLDRKSVV